MLIVRGRSAATICSVAAAAETTLAGQAQQVGAVFGGRQRILVGDRLVDDERFEADHASAHAQQFEDVVTEGFWLRPVHPGAACRRARDRRGRGKRPRAGRRRARRTCIRPRPPPGYAPTPRVRGAQRDDRGRPATPRRPGHRAPGSPGRRGSHGPAAKKPVDNAVALEQMVESASAASWSDAFGGAWSFISDFEKRSISYATSLRFRSFLFILQQIV